MLFTIETKKGWKGKQVVTVSRDTRVGMTADGLTTVRSSKEALANGIIDPFAQWFRTDAGDHLAEKARQIDPVYFQYNLTRFGYTTARLNELAHEYKQMVFLGSGFDCRAIWLDEIQLKGVQVYEVETARKLEEKMDFFRRRGVQIPPNNAHIAADLRDFESIPAQLDAAGFRFDEPALVMTEGVFFFLPTETSYELLRPDWLGLAPGSRLLFDAWSDERVNNLNTRTPAIFNGIELFRNFPFFTDTLTLEENLLRLGYADVEMTSLDDLTPKFFAQPLISEFKDGWVLVDVLV